MVSEDGALLFSEEDKTWLAVYLHKLDLKLEDVIVVFDTIQKRGSVNVFCREGDIYTVQKVNDLCITLAEHVGVPPKGGKFRFVSHFNNTLYRMELMSPQYSYEVSYSLMY